VLGGSVLLSSGHDKLLDVGGCTISSDRVIDLNDNSLIVRGGQAIRQIELLVVAGRNGGTWDGTDAITSSAARTNPLHNTTLGVIRGDKFLAVYGPGSTFHGRSVSALDVLVDYTYYGDTDLNGVINFDDYARLDAGFNNHRTGWFNGDFDLNGVINFDDYALIDYAFNTQSGPPTFRSVPEPSFVAVLVIGGIGTSCRRHSRRTSSHTMAN